MKRKSRINPAFQPKTKIYTRDYFNKDVEEISSYSREQGESCGYSPIPVSSCCCLCEQQIKYIMEQLIDIYRNQTFDFFLEDGTSIRCVPVAITDNFNKSLLLVRTNNTAEPENNQYINLCRIKYLKISDAQYASNIKYLTGPISKELTGCSCSIETILKSSNEIMIDYNFEDNTFGVIKAVNFGIVAIQKGSELHIAVIPKVSSFKTR